MLGGAVVLLLILLVALPGAAQTTDPILRDGGFEADPRSQLSGWRPTPGEFDVVQDFDQPFSGESSLRISEARIGRGQFAAVAQAIDATHYRGQTMRYRAAVRATAPPGTGVGLWMRVDRAGGSPGFFDNMSDRPVQSSQWAKYEIVGPVADDATKITVGLLVSGRGSAWIDDAVLELVDESAVVGTSAVAPTSEALRNLTAFARLYGYVRWFSGASDPQHPAWTAIAVEGARDVEAAAGDADLIARLRRWFEPMAPGLVINTAPILPPEPSSDQALIRWSHRGVHFSGAIYQSERVPASAEAWWSAEIAPGLFVSVPLTAPASHRGVTGPYAPVGAARAEDRATRLGGVVIAWNVFRHFYPYFDDDGRAWEARLDRSLISAATAADEPAYFEALERLVAALEDGHGGVWPHPRAFGLPLAWRPIGQDWVVTGVGQGVQGVAPGDIVLSIDGETPSDLIERRLTRVSGSTPQHRLHRAGQDVLLRETSAPTVVELQKSDGSDASVSITPVRAEAVAPILSEPRPSPITWLPAGAWYFDLTRLDTDRLVSGLASVGSTDPIVFDLRGYPRNINQGFLGRLTDEPLHTPPFLIPIGTLPEARDRHWESGGWSISPATPRLNGPIAFLTDARAVSYSETLLAIIDHHDLGVIVGSPTAGTNGNINQFSVPGGYQIRWTGMKVTNYDGSDFMGRGVAPSVAVERTLKGVRAGRDEVLEEAIRILTRDRPEPLIH